MNRTLQRALLLALPVLLLGAIWGVRILPRLRWNALEADFGRPFVEAKVVVISLRKFDNPLNPQPPSRELGRLTGPQFAAIASKIHVEPFQPELIYDAGTALDFKAVDGATGAVAQFSLILFEGESWLGGPNNSPARRQRFGKLRLTRASWRAIKEDVFARYPQIKHMEGGH